MIWATLLGIAQRPRGALAFDRDRPVLLPEPHRQLGHDRAPELADSSTASVRSGSRASMRLRSSSSPASDASRCTCTSAARPVLGARASTSGGSARKSARTMSSMTLQRRQRRAQLVRRGRDERAPRLLLLAQVLLHRRERAAEVADLVAAAVGLELGVRARCRRRAVPCRGGGGCAAPAGWRAAAPTSNAPSDPGGRRDQ